VFCKLIDYSIRAQDILPTMLKYLDASKLDDNQLAALDRMKKWNKIIGTNSVGASIFNTGGLSFTGFGLE
jgi:penicillin amidase